MSEEAKILLRHPDYRERLLALKLDSVTPEDVSMAILDPHEEVFNAAFQHPLSSHALDILASVSRDAAGNPIPQRHGKLLSDPRCHNQHIESMKRAVEGDSYLPIRDQSLQLKQLESRLAKSDGVSSQIHLSHAALPPTQKYIKVAHEENPHPELLQAYNSAVNSSSPIHPQDADLHHPGQASPKVIYKTPEGHKFLVKPYFESLSPKSGWGELTSQELYKAAEIPHLHQKVFPASYKNVDHHIPVVVIKIEKAKPVHKATAQDFSDSAKDDARKIAVMDFLTSNKDRHRSNLMVRDNGMLLAIDHGLNHSYSGDADSLGEYVPKKANKNDLGEFISNAPGMVTLGGVYGNSEEAPGYHDVIKQWWPNVSADVKRAFNKRLDLVENEPLREHLERGFNAKHQWLDNAAKGDYENFLSELKKAVKIDKELKDHIDYFKHKGLITSPEPLSPETDSIHKELLSAHPSSLQPQVDDFETYVNRPTHGVTAEKGNLSGVEEKILISNRGNKHLIKNGSLLNGTRSGWNELTSQAMYHAGGIGHLHQKVHATKLNIKEGNKVRQQNAIVIHFKPGKWTPMYDIKPHMNLGLKLHGDDLRKAALMDFVTNNDDRHGGNIVFGENWEPQVIDHGYAFSKDRFASMGDNEISAYVGSPDQKTYDWWKKNKESIVAAFNKHVNMIPDKKERAIYKKQFQNRVDLIDNKDPWVFEDNLVKALGSGDFLHNQHTAFETQKDIDLSGVHEKLTKSHPPIVTPGVRHFEITLNNNKNTIEPKQEQDEMYGLQPKALYESGGKNYMVKTANDPSTKLSAWNEMTSQAMYHAGGIGHLHQKVHATVGKTGLNRQEPAHAIAVHMEPNTMTFNDAYGYRSPMGQTYVARDKKRAYKAMNDPQHVQTFKKMGVMDYLTSNNDRHGHNIILKPDGSPIAIDHGRAFYSDRKYGLGEERDKELQYSDGKDDLGLTEDPNYQNKWFNTWADLARNSAATGLGGPPDKETWDWWDKAKEPMLEKFKEHLNMLPDKNARERMLESFMVRYNTLDSLRNSKNSPLLSTNPVVSSNQENLDLAHAKTGLAIPSETLQDRTEVA